MADQLTKPDVGRIREEEIELGDPLLTENTAEEDRARREKTIARLQLLWDHRRFLGRCVGSGLILSAVIAILIPNQYTSTARLMPPDQGGSSGLTMLAALAGKAGGGSLASLGSSILGLRTTSDLFAGIVKSRTVEDDLVTKFDLRNLYHDKRWEDARKKLEARTLVDVDTKTEIISIAVTDRSPQRARDMAQEYVQQLDDQVRKLNTGSAHLEREFLDQRLAQVKQDLETSETQFSRFASKNTTLDIEAQGRAMISAEAQLEGQLIATETELEELGTLYTPNNERVREAQARADELRRQIQKLGGKPGTSTTAPTQGSGSLLPPIRELPLLGVNYADLYRKTKVEEAIFETLTQEDEVAKVEEVKETPIVKELDPPQIPENKSSPHRVLITLAGTVLAGVFAVACVLAGARWQEVDPLDPGKVLANDVFQTVRSHLPWQSQNGLAAEGLAGKASVREGNKDGNENSKE